MSFETGSVTKYTRYWREKNGKGRRHKVSRILADLQWVRQSVVYHGIEKWAAVVHPYLIEGKVAVPSGEHQIVHGQKMQPLYRIVSLDRIDVLIDRLKAELALTPKSEKK